MRPCFKFTAAAGDRPAVLALDDEIGFWGTQAKDFRAQLDAVSSNNLVVEINSVGGEVMAGLGMYNMLRSWASAAERTITTRVTALAASIASVVALAGDKREMPKNAFAMIHGPSTGAWGTEEDLREAADVVAKIKGSMRSIYMDRMGIDEAKADELLAKDNWLTAQEAKDIGFATDITDDVTATARYDVSKLDLPATATLFKAKAPAPKPEPDDKPLAEVIKVAAKAAGLEAYEADFLLQADSPAAAQACIKAAGEIVALCQIAGKANDAGKYIKANKSTAQVRAALLAARAKEDPEINNADPDANKQKTPTAEGGFSPNNTWAKLRQKPQQQSKGR